MVTQEEIQAEATEYGLDLMQAYYRLRARRELLRRPRRAVRDDK